VKRGICPIGALYLLRSTLVSYDILSLTATSALQFQRLGHVTSSVTWQFDQPSMASCRLSVITIRSSCTVTEI